MIESFGSGAAKEFMAFVDDDHTSAAVREAASLAGLDTQDVRPGGVAAAVDHLSAFPAPAILLVDVSGCEDVFGCMESLADACEQHTRVIALGAVNDIELYRRLLEMGLTEYLVKPPSSPALIAALRRARASRAAPAQAPTGTCRKAALIGAKGGAGVTSLALSVGTILARDHKCDTVLLDLDLRLGAMALSLDLEPSRGLREILSTPERIDSLLIESAVTHASDKLRLLSTEEPIDQAFNLPGEGVVALLKWLEGNSNVILMDVPRHLDEFARAALAAADVKCIVTDLSLVGMRDTKRLLAVASEAGEGETLVVANRVGGVAGEVPQAEFERGIGAKLDFIVPNDAKAAAEAADRGKSLVEGSPGKAFADELNRLAVRLAGISVGATDQSASPSWLKRILR